MCSDIKGDESQVLKTFITIYGKEMRLNQTKWQLQRHLLVFQGSVKYQEFFLQSLLNSICDKQAEVRQAAVYGVGIMAMYGGDAYAHLFSGKMTLLFEELGKKRRKS